MRARVILACRTPLMVFWPPLCAYRQSKADARGQSEERASYITPAALKKAEELWTQSGKYEGLVQLSFPTDSRVVGTVYVSSHALVTVTLRVASDAGSPPVSCTCGKPLDLGMPCKHAVAVFRAVGFHPAVAPRFNRLDRRWFHKVWHTATWREQYARAFASLEVPKHAVMCISAFTCADAVMMWCCAQITLLQRSALVVIPPLKIKTRGRPKRRRTEARAERVLCAGMRVVVAVESMGTIARLARATTRGLECPK